MNALQRLTLVSFLLTGAPAARAVAPPVITCSDGPIEVLVGGDAAAVDPSLTVTGAGTSSGATVLIRDFQAGDVLSFSSAALPAGVTGSWSSGTGVLTFLDDATTADWQTLLRTVTIATSSNSPTQRTVVFTLGNSLPFEDNGHYYEFIEDAAISWTDAKDDAEALNLFGLQGYLVTVTTAAENSFVSGKLEGEGWMGANDAGVESVWRWVTGPEGLEGGTGRHFFTQTSSSAGSPNFASVYGSVLPGGGVAIGGYYQNWNTSEPNDVGGAGEDYAHFLGSGKWNDYPVSLGGIAGYVVEYGGMPGDPALQIEASRDVDMGYTLTYTADSGGDVQGDTEQFVTPGGDGTVVTAVPWSGRHFVQWSDASEVNPRTDLNVSASGTVNATFALDTYNLSYTAGAHGVLVGPTSQAVQWHTDGVAVTAVPDPGFEFGGWSDGVAANSRTDRGVEMDVDVRANFITTPTVTTLAVTDIRATTATSGGTVTDDGGSDLSARGVCWSTESGPTTSDASSADGTGAGTYTSALTDLDPETTYYVRAYARNSAGTAYGQERSFRTADMTSNGDGSGDGDGDGGGDGSGGAPELRVEIVAPSGASAVGEEMAFQLNVRNVGTAPASGAVLRIPLPAGTEFVAALQVTQEAEKATPLDAVVENGDIVIELGSINPNDGFAIELVLRARSAGAVVLTAGASSVEVPTPATGEADATVDVDDQYVEVVTTTTPVRACGALGMAPALLLLGLAGLKWRGTGRGV